VEFLLKVVVNMGSIQIKKLDFELAYLALLTQAGVKPLSRWEKDLLSEDIEILKNLGLMVEEVHRSVQTGTLIEEILFSTCHTHLDTYIKHFEGKPVVRTPQTQRREGLLFGYPSCCVEHYIRKGYTANGLPQEDQKILFHWACPNCQITPLLVPRYQEAYRRCRALFERGTVFQYNSEQRSHFRKRVAVAASLALLVSGSGVLVQESRAQEIGSTGVIPVALGSNLSDDPHVIPLPPEIDRDQDCLTDDEELHMGTNPDTDGNGVLNGVELAIDMWHAIQELPRNPSETAPSAIEMKMDGLEVCQSCGQVVNMGCVAITHPSEGLSATIPYIGLHYMEHGSFIYNGDYHGQGTVNARLVYCIVHSDGFMHMLPVEGDGDHDGCRRCSLPCQFHFRFN
jgi:hypothetical protein